MAPESLLEIPAFVLDRICVFMGRFTPERLWSVHCESGTAGKKATTNSMGQHRRDQKQKFNAGATETNAEVAETR
jgi:hypothetical protein